MAMTISQLKQERQKSDGRVQDLLRQNSKLQAIRKAMDFSCCLFLWEGWYAEGTCDLSKVCCNFSSLRYNQNYIFLLTLTQHHFKGCCSYWILGTPFGERYPDSFLQPGCHSQEELNATRSSRTGTGRSSNELSGNNYFTITGTPYPSLWGTARDGFGYLNRNIAWSMIRATDCMDHIWWYNCRWLGR